MILYLKILLFNIKYKYNIQIFKRFKFIKYNIENLEQLKKYINDNSNKKYIFLLK